MGRKYTGYDATASGKRAGTERFVQLLCAHFGNGIWNNGTWVVRNMNTPPISPGERIRERASGTTRRP